MLIDIPTPLVMGMLGREMAKYFIMFDDSGKIPINLVVMGSANALEQKVEIKYYPMEGIELWARYFTEDVIGKGIHNVPKETITKLINGDTEAFTTGELVDFCNLFINKVYDFMAVTEPTTSVVPLQAFLNPEHIVVGTKPAPKRQGPVRFNMETTAHMLGLEKEAAEAQVSEEDTETPVLFPDQKEPDGE